MRSVYLDSNATTRVAPEVLEEMLPYMTERFGNPSSFHTFGSSVMEEVERARARVASLIGAEPGEVYFNSGGTEGDNTALAGAQRIDPSRTEVLTTAVEHPAVLEAAEALRHGGCAVHVAPVDGNGLPDLAWMEQAAGPSTAIVSMMAANNETGVIMPLEEAASIASEAGSLFHTDAVQSVGKVPVSVRDSGIDILTLSAHKLHGPKGVGAMYVRSGVELPPLVRGGHQEEGMRAGTLNVPGIVGLGRAAELAERDLREDGVRISRLLDRLERGILESCPGARIAAAGAERLPNTATVLFGTVESEAVLTLLDSKGISASSGSACSTGSKGPSYVLSAMGVPVMDANTAIRFSLSRYTTEEEIDYVLDVLPPLVAQLRRISPYVYDDS